MIGKNGRDHVWGWVWSHNLREVDSSDIICGYRKQKKAQIWGESKELSLVLTKSEGLWDVHVLWNMAVIVKGRG